MRPALALLLGLVVAAALLAGGAEARTGAASGAKGAAAARRASLREHTPHESQSLVCTATGPCVPCSDKDKEEDWSSCGSTGHRQPITCRGDREGRQHSRGPETWNTFQSCPAGPDEDSWSVLAFEGVMFAFLAVSAPIVYYRRGK
mmetsp:Transcript_63474/g.200762  ORF Transcript_63474/g.200762 Transcript_63474/m.200762 type:complete len:146 (-) Transcript_63474:50-487(-)